MDTDLYAISTVFLSTKSNQSDNYQHSPTPSLMNIFINNKHYFTEEENLATLISSLNLSDRGLAVAVGNKMIPRTEWASTLLEEDMKVVIIKAACGG